MSPALFEQMLFDAALLPPAGHIYTDPKNRLHLNTNLVQCVLIKINRKKRKLYLHDVILFQASQRSAEAFSAYIQGEARG